MFEVDNPLIAIINGLLVIFALVGLILFLANIFTPRIGMGQDIQHCSTFIIQPCILIASGLAYVANSAFISFGWLSEEQGAIFSTIDLAIAALSLSLIFLTISILTRFLARLATLILGLIFLAIFISLLSTKF
jgi:hypothetical protein